MTREEKILKAIEYLKAALKYGNEMPNARNVKVWQASDLLDEVIEEDSPPSG